MAENGWQIKTIGDLGEIITGGTPTSRQPKYFGDIYPFITPSDINGFTRYIKTTRFLSEKGKEDQLNKLLPSGAVCFVCIASIGKICMVREPSFTNQQINSIVVDKGRYNNFYVYYLLRNMADEVKNIASGTAAPIVNKSLFSSINVTIPSLSIQYKIASILSAYDDLIENNLRRIKILEEMAQALYREWFVHFRFPGHEKVCFVDSPLGKIPEEWAVTNLLDIAEVTYGYAFKSRHFNTSGDGNPVVRIRDVLAGTTSTFSTERASKKYLIKNGDILVGMDGDFHMGFWVGGEAYLVQRVARFRPIDTASVYLLFMLLEGPIRRFNATITGTTVAHLGNKHIKTIQVVLPTPEILARANEFFSPMLELVLNLRVNNQLLTCTRDLLLPKLISGELDVSKLDIDVPDVS